MSRRCSDVHRRDLPYGNSMTRRKVRVLTRGMEWVLMATWPRSERRVEARAGQRRCQAGARKAPADTCRGCRAEEGAPFVADTCSFHGLTRSGLQAPVSVSTPLPAGSSTATKPVRRRIPIKIVEDDAPLLSATPSASTSSDLMKPVSSRSLKGSPSTSTPTPAPPKSILKTTKPAEPPAAPPPTSFQAAKEARDQARKPKVGGGIFKANGTHTLFKGSIETQDEEPRITDTTPTPTPTAPAQSGRQLPLPVSADKTAPTTLFTLQRDWAHCSTPEARWELLCVSFLHASTLLFNSSKQTVPPSSLPALCKTSLEPAFLIAVLDTLRSLVASGIGQADVRNAMREYLDGFAKVQRFDTVVMFLSAQEKDVVRDVLRALGVKSWAGVSV